MVEQVVTVELYGPGQDGGWEILGEEFPLHWLGETVPKRGDVIVIPRGVIKPRTLKDYRLFEVEGKYFFPGVGDRNLFHIKIVGRVRLPNDRESGLF